MLSDLLQRFQRDSYLDFSIISGNTKQLSSTPVSL
jgi:hypothetical protein